MRLGQGLVVGKFLPVHQGHCFLLDQARRRCDELTIVIAARARDPFTPGVRKQWLSTASPGARVLVADRVPPYGAVLEWAAELKELVGPVDVLFSSERYGPALSRELGASCHVMVDQYRSVVPISGSAIRRFPPMHWNRLSPDVQGALRRDISVHTPSPRCGHLQEIFSHHNADHARRRPPETWPSRVKLCMTVGAAQVSYAQSGLGHGLTSNTYDARPCWVLDIRRHTGVAPGEYQRIMRTIGAARVCLEDERLLIYSDHKDHGSCVTGLMLMIERLLEQEPWYA